MIDIDLLCWQDIKAEALDSRIREAWMAFAIRQHGWPNGATPAYDRTVNYNKFLTGWHESEYQVFKAGWLASITTKEA